MQFVNNKYHEIQKEKNARRLSLARAMHASSIQDLFFLTERSITKTL